MADLFAYIEFYNRNRRHSSLGFILQGLNRGQQTRGPLRLGGEKTEGGSTIPFGDDCVCSIVVL